METSYNNQPHHKKKRKKLSPRQRLVNKNLWTLKPDPGLQAELSLLPFSLETIAHEIHQQYFSTLPICPQVFFSKTKYIAYIAVAPENGNPTPYIVINSYYNHSQTPDLVIRAILKHEFIHIHIPAQVRDGMRISHPPEFWEMESLIAPEMDDIWAYNQINLRKALISLPGDETHEGAILLKPRLIRHMRDQPRVPLAECLKIWRELTTPLINQQTSPPI